MLRVERRKDEMRRCLSSWIKMKISRYNKWNFVLNQDDFSNWMKMKFRRIAFSSSMLSSLASSPSMLLLIEPASSKLSSSTAWSSTLWSSTSWSSIPWSSTPWSSTPWSSTPRSTQQIPSLGRLSQTFTRSTGGIEKFTALQTNEWNRQRQLGNFIRAPKSWMMKN